MQVLINDKVEQILMNKRMVSSAEDDAKLM